MVSPICTGNESTRLILIGQVQRRFQNFVIHQRFFFFFSDTVSGIKPLFIFRKSSVSKLAENRGII